jgi:hypothetical protein
MIASINPIFSGSRVVSAPDVKAFETAVVRSSEEFRRKRRIACGAFNTHRYLSPRLRTMSAMNKFKYMSHKYLRWFSAVFLVLSAAFAIAAIAAMGHMLVAAIVVGLVLGILLIGRHVHVPVVSGVTEITLSILATGQGVMEAIAGHSYQTWTPPARG